MFYMTGKKSEEDRGLDAILRAMHPVPSGQDGGCPKIEWQGLGHGSGIGGYKCLLQEDKYGDISHGGGSENLDYLPCNNSDHETCPVYLKSLRD